MRFFAVHDPDGNISRLAGSPATGPVMSPLQLGELRFFTEVKLPPRVFDPADAKSYKRLAEIPKSHVVEMPLRKPARLVKKAPGQGSLKALNIFPNPVDKPQIPRFDVTLKEPAAAAVNVMIVLLPNTQLGSLAIPPGETLMALSAPLPWHVIPGEYTVAAIGSADTVTAVLRVT